MEDKVEYVIPEDEGFSAIDNPICAGQCPSEYRMTCTSPCEFLTSTETGNADEEFAGKWVDEEYAPG